MENIEDRIKNVVVGTLRIPDDSYAVDLAAGDITEWDSLGHVSLLQALEQEFKIAFDVGDAIDIESVEDIIVTVKRYIS